MIPFCHTKKIEVIRRDPLLPVVADSTQLTRRMLSLACCPCPPSPHEGLCAPNSPLSVFCHPQLPAPLRWWLLSNTAVSILAQESIAATNSVDIASPVPTCRLLGWTFIVIRSGFCPSRHSGFHFSAFLFPSLVVPSQPLCFLTLSPFSHF